MRKLFQIQSRLPIHRKEAKGSGKEVRTASDIFGIGCGMSDSSCFAGTIE